MMKRSILLFVLALCALDASAANVSFSRPIRLTTEWGPFGSTAIGDVDGDGRKDLAVTRASGYETPTLLVYLQRTDGTFAAPLQTVLPPAYGSDLPILLVDLDKDGKPELFVGQGNTQVSIVKVANGALTKSSFPTRMSCAYAAAGDIDGDGNVDIACHDEQVTATIFFGNGAGGFRNNLEVGTGAGTWYKEWEIKGIDLADVTGDGRPDLLVTSSLISSFFVLQNNSLGGFFPGATAYPHPYTPTGVYPAAVRAVDTDGDGIDEVVTVSPDNRPNAYINVYKRRANGYLGLSARIPTFSSTTALLASDLDGDGDKELVLGHHQMGAISVAGANGSGLQSQSRFELPGFGNAVWDLFEIVGSSHALSIGDVDSDGCPDLAATTFTGTTLLFGCEPNFHKLPVNDVDGDGFADILWREGPGGVQYSMFRVTQYCIRAYYNCPTTVDPYQEPQALGDFDGDGTSDILWRNPATGANTVLLASLFPRMLTPAGTAWRAMGTGDFDGDDRSDLFWRNSVSGANSIWRSADASAQIAVAPVGNTDWKVAGIGDFDGDGKSDVLWHHAISGANTIWRSGNNLTQMAMTGVSNTAWQIAGIGDFDGDGRDDVVWRNAVSGANTIWLAANNATQRSVTGVFNPDWQIATIGDYDGDGRADLFWRNGASGANTIWLSANSATQLAVPTWPTYFTFFGQR
ncbi:Calcium-binding RTX toxin-like protein [Lysobacter dokdonensis DS-58]|uniref:Calcium-binding RTX toxin-like protein n=1 Tax=Lysobacter dokdonensis DS-58 TaxID=1300345 RepID=A0A0A2WJE8_9GAMM|nr:VCBS repeat-containing protein [Lysobacter dokdonensis]KGQ20301.1 Calcium-binding RTX toxin-like protein [Lysobacter dokdonensis DS-58]